MTNKNARAPGKVGGATPKESSESRPEPNPLSQLLQMSHALKNTLEPVEARTSFINNLHDQIISNVENARLIIQRRRKRRRQFKWTAIGAGGVVYIISTGIILTRITRWGLNRLRNSANKQGN